MIAFLSTCTDLELPARPAGAAAVTAFICANCARAGRRPESAGGLPPAPPRFEWPFPVQEVLVPCTGRIQPEHVLKVFELGADLVLAVACAEGNCHYLEGSKRCGRRIDYLRSVLDDIGLGGERLLLFHLTGTAAQDTALGAGATNGDAPGAASAGDAATGAPGAHEAQDLRIAAIREEVARALGGLPPNPLYIGSSTETTDEAYQEVDTSDDDNEE